MPRWVDTESEWESEDFDPDEEGDEFESSDDDSEPTIPCPYCRREIHEDSERCPYCEKYLSAEDSPSSPKPWWFIVGFLACLAIVMAWIWYRM